MFYGGAARLELAENAPHGVVVTLSLPARGSAR